MNEIDAAQPLPRVAAEHSGRTECPGCDHPFAKHFVDVTGVARCLHVAHGTSSTGVMGVPWTWECDCADFRSEQTLNRREIEATDTAADERRVQALVDEIVRKCGLTE